MNICEAIRLARQENKAFRQAIWAAGQYAYHGMDNLIRFSSSDREIAPCAALFLSDDWELFDGAPYHGKLAEAGGRLMKTLGQLRSEFEAAKKAAADKEAEEYRLRNEQELANVVAKLDTHVAEALFDFERKVTDALRHRESELSLRVWNTWSPAGDHLAEAVIAELAKSGYVAQRSKTCRDVRFSDDSREETVYNTYVIVSLNQ
jgi:hypothetical protein